VFRTRADGDEEFLALIGPGNYFGELGPLLNLPRSASARARTDCRLTSYPLRAFRQQFPVARTGLAPVEVVARP
jgi:putative ABC transport system ATP-binding protein